MATVALGCMCVQITIDEGTGMKQIQPKMVYCLRQFLLVANMLPW